jgi:hypothetical protein
MVPPAGRGGPGAIGTGAAGGSGGGGGGSAAAAAAAPAPAASPPPPAPSIGLCVVLWSLAGELGPGCRPVDVARRPARLAPLAFLARAPGVSAKALDFPPALGSRARSLGDAAGPARAHAVKDCKLRTSAEPGRRFGAVWRAGGQTERVVSEGEVEPRTDAYLAPKSRKRESMTRVKHERDSSTLDRVRSMNAAERLREEAWRGAPRATRARSGGAGAAGSGCWRARAARAQVWLLRLTHSRHSNAPRSRSTLIISTTTTTTTTTAPTRSRRPPPHRETTPSGASGPPTTWCCARTTPADTRAIKPPLRVLTGRAGRPLARALEVVAAGPAGGVVARA